MSNYKKVYNQITNMKHKNKMDRITNLARLVAHDNKEKAAEDIACIAFEYDESMFGSYYDPTQDEYDDLIDSIKYTLKYF